MLCRKEVASLAASLAPPSWLGGCGSGRVSPLCGPGGQHQGIPSARHGSPPPPAEPLLSSGQSLWGQMDTRSFEKPASGWCLGFPWVSVDLVLNSNHSRTIPEQDEFLSFTGLSITFNIASNASYFWT